MTDSLFTSTEWSGIVVLLIFVLFLAPIIIMSILYNNKLADKESKDTNSKEPIKKVFDT